jgi:hypothetical protein
MTKETTYHSYDDFHKKCFPNSILERLDKTLCDLFNVPESHKYNPKSYDPNTGVLELAKPSGYSQKRRDELVDTIKEFYIQEGFKVTEPGFIFADKQDKHYNIFVAEHDTAWSVNIW